MSDSNPLVCPESSVDSASRRNDSSRRGNASEDLRSCKLVTRESTLESAPRRDFLRKAAFAGVAAGFGSTIVGEKLLPSSFATTSCGGKQGNTFQVIGRIFLRSSYEGCSSYQGAFVSQNLRTCCNSSAVAGYAETVNFSCYNEACPCAVYPAKKPIPNNPTGVAGFAWCNIGVSGWSNSGAGTVGSTEGLTPVPPGKVGVYGLAKTGTGVTGISPCGTGVFGCSTYGIGVDGASACGTGVYGKGKSRGVFGSSVTGYGVAGCSPCNNGIWGGSINKAGVYGQSTNKYGVHGCSVCSIGVQGNGGLYGVQGCATSNSGRHVGVVGNTGHGNGSAGVAGYANGGCTCNCTVTAGVYGQSEALLGQGVSGLATTRSGSGVGVFGQSNASGGVGVVGQAGTSTTVPLAARGILCQSTNLQEWQAQRLVCILPEFETVSVVNKCGWLGVGSTTACTTLYVNGGVSAKIVSTTKNYTMKASDFAVLASASPTAGITVTLPAAKTSSGMIVFVKKADSNSKAVTIASHGSDTVEGKSFINLNKQFDSLQLISNGKNEWYVIGNSICGSFTS